MYYAIQEAPAGQTSRFPVYNAADAHLGRAGLRDINPPARN
jgi:hypothetical protein